VSQTLAINGSTDVLALEDAPGVPGSYGSISRLRADGSPAWTVAPPTNESEDAWTAVQIDRNVVLANSWSCLAVTIDLDTGAERARSFTK
jgi:hypothetical protein